MLLSAIDSARSRVKGVAPLAKQLGDLRLQALGVALEDLGRGDRHRGIEENLGRRHQPAAFDASAEHVEQLLGAFQAERGHDDVAAPPEGVGHGGI
jgi:hypothetical protein